MGDGQRTRVVVLLACVLGLETADSAVIGAVAHGLKQSLDMSNAQLGLLAAAGPLVGGIATLPAGMLVDRFARTRVLSISIVLWSLAMVAAGAAPSFGMLLASRVGLGMVAATAFPAVASLMGDLFEQRERARVYSSVLTGEIVGTAVGFLVAGELTAVLSWRFGFWLLAPPGVALAVAIARVLPEPARGASGSPAVDPPQLSLWSAVIRILRVRTVVVIIIASALGDYFFAGVRTFGLLFFEHRYGIGQSAATTLMVLIGLASVAGVLTGGRLADRLLRGGRRNARIVVAAASYLLAVGLLLGAFSDTPPLVSIPLFALGAAALAGPNPPLDAARLDVMHYGLWGRAEGVRTVARTAMTAAAPLAFGALTDAFGNADTASGASSAFMLMLIPLALAGLTVLFATRTYPADVAAAAQSKREAEQTSGQGRRAPLRSAAA
jgi:predicted MFS family arabinose efflux permease